MKNKSTRAVKPLTKIMVDVLLDCAEKELMKVEPSDVGTTRSAKGLIERQLLTPRIYVNASGKKVMSLYLTDLGRDYVNEFI